MKTYEILLAQSDEDAYHPALIRWTLQKKGYRVTTTSGNGSAVEILRKNDFDLVITDLLGVLEKAKELNPENTAILMLNTKSGIIPFQDIRSAADDYLFIPFELTELELRVARGLERSEWKRRRAHPALRERQGNGGDLDTLRILFGDITGSLVSMSATLKLLTRGYWGKMDQGVKKSLEELLSQTVSLVRLTERCLGNFSTSNIEVENGTKGVQRSFFNSQQVSTSSVDPFFHGVFHSSPFAKGNSSFHKGPN
jgi:DNA-binding response OmpR family regulator